MHIPQDNWQQVQAASHIEEGLKVGIPVIVPLLGVAPVASRDVVIFYARTPRAHMLPQAPCITVCSAAVRAGVLPACPGLCMLPPNLQSHSQLPEQADAMQTQCF